jgi:hypothetical protein
MSGFSLGGGGSSAGPGSPGFSTAEVQLQANYTLTATEATGTASSSIVMDGATLVFFTIEVTNAGTGPVTELRMSFESRTADTEEWSPLFIEDLDTATGFATMTPYIVVDDITGLSVTFRRVYRVPAWAYEVRCTVWGATGVVTNSNVNVFALLR